jgi:hypothetical protein
VSGSGLLRADFEESPVRKQLAALLNTFTMALKVTEPRGGQAEKATLSGLRGSVHGGDGRVYVNIDNVLPTIDCIVRLLHTLHALWAPTCGAIPAEARIVLGYRRSDLAMLLLHAGQSVPKPAAPSEIKLDGLQLWLGTLRDSCHHRWE